MFQSPRSGKFVSDWGLQFAVEELGIERFNPLDRGNLYQILFFLKECNAMKKSFNPLDRGNLYQMRWLL